MNEDHLETVVEDYLTARHRIEEDTGRAIERIQNTRRELSIKQRLLGVALAITVVGTVYASVESDRIADYQFCSQLNEKEQHETIAVHSKRSCYDIVQGYRK